MKKMLFIGLFSAFSLSCLAAPTLNCHIYEEYMNGEKKVETLGYIKKDVSSIAIGDTHEVTESLTGFEERKYHRMSDEEKEAFEFTGEYGVDRAPWNVSNPNISYVAYLERDENKVLGISKLKIRVKGSELQATGLSPVYTRTSESASQGLATELTIDGSNKFMLSCRLKK